MKRAFNSSWALSKQTSLCARSKPKPRPSFRLRLSILQRRCQSSIHSGNGDAITATAAKDLSKVFELDRERGLEIAKLISNSARNEISLAQQKLAAVAAAESKSKSATATATATSIANVEKPSSRTLRIHALIMGIPFIGFGIMDNAILIWAGDQIDTHLGVYLGISTLCAAAIGNIISDVAGAGLGAYIEDFCATKLKLPKINLSNAQRSLRSVRMAGQVGIAIGLTVGCVIGMFPLLFIDSEEVQSKKQDAKIDALFRDVINETHKLMGAESTSLFLVVDDEHSTLPSNYTERRRSESEVELQSESVDGNSSGISNSNTHSNSKGQYLYAKYKHGRNSGMEGMRVPLGRGIVSKAVISGKVLNTNDVLSHPDYDAKMSVIQPLLKGGEENMLINAICVPVVDQFGNTIAIIQAASRATVSPSGFSKSDEQMLKVLAAHISVTLQNLHTEGGASLKEIIQILKEHSSSK